ncbi:MAG: peroxidase family protein [bacterium]
MEQLQAPDSFCPYDKETYDTCNANYAYRSYDGTCNNVNYVWWGKSETPFKRILTPLYDDGLNGPRVRSVTRTSRRGNRFRGTLRPFRTKQAPCADP